MLSDSKTGYPSVDKPWTKYYRRLKRIYWRKTDENAIVRVYPVRIENVIERNQEVSRCAVLGTKNGESGYDTIAFVTLSNKHDNNTKERIKAELLKLCKTYLPGSHVPNKIILLDKNAAH